MGGGTRDPWLGSGGMGQVQQAPQLNVRSRTQAASGVRGPRARPRRPGANHMEARAKQPMSEQWGAFHIFTAGPVANERLELLRLESPFRKDDKESSGGVLPGQKEASLWGRQDVDDGAAPLLRRLQKQVMEGMENLQAVAVFFRANFNDDQSGPDGATSDQRNVALAGKDAAKTKREVDESHLVLESSAFSEPHPDKARTGGEDSYFIAQVRAR